MKQRGETDPSLESVAEGRRSLELPLAPLGLAVAHAEVERETDEGAERTELQADRRPHAGKVTRVVDLTEDGRGDDTSHAAHSDADRRRDGTLRVRADVVGLVRERGGDVRLSSGDREERSKVTDTEGLGVGHCSRGISNCQYDALL